LAPGLSSSAAWFWFWFYFFTSTTLFTSITATCFKSITTSFTSVTFFTSTTSTRFKSTHTPTTTQCHLARTRTPRARVPSVSKSRTLQARTGMTPSSHRPLIRTLNLHREYKPMASFDTRLHLTGTALWERGTVPSSQTLMMNRSLSARPKTEAPFHRSLTLTRI